MLVQADEVADLADAKPGVCAAFVHSLGLPDLKATKLLKALGVAQGEVRRRAMLRCQHGCARHSTESLQTAPTGPRMGVL